LGHHRGRNSYPDLLQRYVPNKLPGTCPIPQIIFLRVLTCHDLKAWVLTSWVSIRLALVTSYETLFLPNLLTLEFFLPGPGLRLAIDRASHVSFQRFCATATLPKYMLMECFSVAIWNRNKGIAAIVAAIWVTNATLLLLGEFSPVSPSR
jgi:hypothetical protein